MASAITSIADVFVPEKSIPAVAERSAKGNRLITSQAVTRSAQLDSIASGSGSIAVKIPGWSPLRNRSVIQKEGVAPDTFKAGQGMQVATILERVIPTAVTALARQRSIESGDPLAFLAGSVADQRTYDQQLTLVSMLRGVHKTALAALTKAAQVEVVGDVTAANLIDSDLVDDAAALLGEIKSDLEGGAIWMHSAIENALIKQDRITFVKNSEGKLVCKMYKGLVVYVSDALSRPGTTSGTVYETYLIAPGRIALGQAAQTNNIGDVSSLVVFGDVAKNDITIYDRFRYLMAVYGAKFIGVPAGESATDAELATAGNWALGVTDVQTAGVVQLLTNG